MIHLPDITSLPFLALYAETHFRFFRFFPSFLFARQPEVVFDAPRRLEPGHDLPVVLIVNDLGRFPADMSDCSISISQKGNTAKRFDFNELERHEINHPFKQNQRVFILPVPRNELSAGRVFINARVTLVCPKGRRYVVFNDNLRTSTKQGFSCTVVNGPLPGSEYCDYGDLHIHSNYSQSHVEFGPPVSVVDTIAHVSGLSFCAITDHSYDLACSVNDYLVADPTLTKWRLFMEEVTQRDRFKTLLIPGEEVSCLNEKNEVVHLCGLAIMDYLPGTLDGARKGRRAQQQLSLGDAVRRIHEQGGIAFAAHPGARQKFLSRLLLYRGNWSENDLSKSGIDAMQILNSGFSKSWSNGKTMWKALLQTGGKMQLLAGNDAHGDFNRYRATAIPFLAISDSPDRYLGYGKTGIYGKYHSMKQITGAIKNHETFVTTGPFAGISSSPSPSDSIVSNRPVLRDDVPTMFIHAKSSEEFGSVSAITCLAGSADGPDERIIFSRRFPEEIFNVCEKITLADLDFKPLYLRVEVACAATAAFSLPARAFTSPVYFA